MPAIGTELFTLADWSKRIDPSGKIADIGELLSLTNEILIDMMFKEGNLPTGERLTQRVGLPDVYWRMLNQGIPPSKSRTAQVDVHVGILEARSQVDKDIATLNGNLAAFRFSEAKPFVEAINQEAASTLFYGTSSRPEEFIGLSAHYAALNAQNAMNIIDAGGTGSDNSSIWLLGWGDSVYGIFPKGSKAGLDHKDLGLVECWDENHNTFLGYRDWWQWKLAVVVKDWRYAVRICNIDINNLASGSGAADLINLLIRAYHRIPTMSNCRPALYANRTILQMLDIQANQKNNVYLSPGKEEGSAKVSFRGIPVRLCDSLTVNEARVV